MEDEILLIELCQNGNTSAFESLVRVYQDRTVRMLYLLLGNFDDAQDVAQETFIRAFKCIHTFRRNSSFSTWLHRIAVNTARNWIRDNKKYRQAVELSDEIKHTDFGRPDDLFLAKERSREILSALSSLVPIYREAIVLRHFQGLSYEDIAAIQQVPVGTVRSRLSKGRELLQKALSQDTVIQDSERMANNGLQKG